MPDVETMQESIPGQNRTIAGIQIIDGNTGKKEKSTIDKVMEVAFSEQFMPITMSILDAATRYLSGTNNKTEESGAVVESVSGAKIQLPNKNF